MSKSRPSRRVRLPAGGLVLFLAGCLDTGTPVDPSEQVSGAVQGQVTDAAGAGVNGPAVTLTVVTPPVNGQSRLLQQATIIADQNGRYVVSFIVDREEPQTALLTVAAVPPPGTGLAQRDSVGIPIKFARGFPPRDTTYVQLALPAR